MSAGRPGGSSTALIVAGYVLAVVLPIVGLVLGIVVISNGPRNHGIGIIAVSIVVGVLSYVWLY